MGMSITITSDIDIPRHMSQVDGDAFWAFAASQWHLLYSQFVPMQTGNLMEQVTITPKQIEHTSPYATPQYIGNFNHRTDLHPLASKEWDKAAIPTQREKLITEMQGYIDDGGLNLNG